MCNNIFYTKCLRRTVGPNLMTHLTLMIFSILEKIPILCSVLSVNFSYLLLEVFLWTCNNFLSRFYSPYWYYLSMHVLNLRHRIYAVFTSVDRIKMAPNPSNSDCARKINWTARPRRPRSQWPQKAAYYFLHVAPPFHSCSQYYSIGWNVIRSVTRVR